MVQTLRRAAIWIGIWAALAWPARAWSNKGHILLTRIAAQRLIADPATPEPMRQWLKEACPQASGEGAEREFCLRQRIGRIPRGVEGIAYWSTVPDLEAAMGGRGEGEMKVAPFDVPERMLHYIDLEYFQKEENRRRYRHDLKNKPDIWTFDAFRSYRDGRWKQGGMLPFRVDQCYQQLVRMIREKRLVDKMGQFPRDEHAAKWAGYLAHYVQDNTQPQHATEDYRSRFYFLDKRKAPDVHWDFEGRLLDDEEADYPRLREEFWRVFERMLVEVEDPVETIDPWRGTIEVSLLSYDALPLIGEAAMKAYKQKGTAGEPQGRHESSFDADRFFHYRGRYRDRDMTLMELKAHQMAWAVKRTQKLWRQAWEEGQFPVEEP